LRVRVLGGFSIEGIHERALGTRKARLLLKRLAVAGGKPVSAGELAAVIWGDDPPANPNDQISVLASRLRGVLGTHRLPRSDAGYCLAADWFDVVELERSVAETQDRLHSGETAAALAAAQVVLGLTGSSNGTLLPEEDGDWLDDVRPAIERLVTRSRLVAAEAAVRAGEFSAARAAAQSVLDRDPYDEAALRLLMRSDVLAGRPGAALVAYATMRERLCEDLGSDPAPETEALHTAIVRGEVPAVSNGSARSAGFVGRSTELGLLDAALGRAAQGERVAVVIEAEPGLGKSALLAAWLSNATAQTLVISGHCDELGRDLPLQPLIDGLDAYLDGVGRHAADELLGPEAAVLGPLLAQRSDEASSAVTTVGDATASRMTLFGALASVLRRAAGERTLILAIDDLHQAASGSAEFLSFALRRIPKVMVVAARRPDGGPDLPDAERIALSGLDLADVVALAGAERAPSLHERSGGHPLFIRELVAAPDDDLPRSIVAAVQGRLARLGQAAGSVEVAASCGTEVDAALIAAIMQRPMPAVLDDLEAATRAALVKPRGAALAFSHELVREAIEAATSPVRKREIHRCAVEELARRRDVDPMALARHARLGGDGVVAAAALGTAAERAKQRFEFASAESLLDEAIALADTASARMARGRLRVARLDLAAARHDALRALELGAGVEGFELAGWIAYYARDYDTALRYADEGVERATNDEVRASCLALAGRIRHTRGLLAEAAIRFEDGIAVASPVTRGMLQVWHGQLLAHRGEPEAAADLARRGLLDPQAGHPFVAGHGHFTLAYSLGLTGRWSEALDALDDLDAWIVRQGDRRFPPMAANLRGWLLRGAGLIHEAIKLHSPAVDVDPGPTFQEAHYAALLDLADCHLHAGQAEGAAATLEKAADITEWTGSMSWRHRNRYTHLTARIDSLGGNHARGADVARAVSTAAAERGDRRYAHRARLTAETIAARAGHPAEPDALGPLLDGFLPLAGPDGWRDLGELAKATGSEQIWRHAETHAARIVTQAAQRPGLPADRVSRTIRTELDRLKP
jgi:DNA-binding SARP family transcriptional activator/tetratricopeptide (TPR) repeat protein